MLYGDIRANTKGIYWTGVSVTRNYIFICNHPLIGIIGLHAQKQLTCTEAE